MALVASSRVEKELFNGCPSDIRLAPVTYSFALVPNHTQAAPVLVTTLANSCSNV